MPANGLLFDDLPRRSAPGAHLLDGFALPVAADLLQAVEVVTAAAPFRHLITPGGRRMSVAMTNCGRLGWVSDRRGYRYDPVDPESGRPWPEMPALFRDLADRAAMAAGFPGFRPDACLINLYTPGARLGMHQDRDEGDLTQPIVSVSLGLPAVFQFGGPSRRDPVTNIELVHGDVVVWGGAWRLAHHGVKELRDGSHPATGRRRINITFRCAGGGR